jgi:hypothetical protein
LEEQGCTSHLRVMDNNAGAAPIRAVSAMTTIAKPIISLFHLPRWHMPQLNKETKRRRRVTIDLINASPHLLRDIGVVEGRVLTKGR